MLSLLTYNIYRWEQGTESRELQNKFACQHIQQVCGDCNDWSFQIFVIKWNATQQAIKKADPISWQLN